MILNRKLVEVESGFEVLWDDGTKICELKLGADGRYVAYPTPNVPFTKMMLMYMFDRLDTVNFREECFPNWRNTKVVTNIK